MNVEIGAEAAQFPEKEYISGIAVAVNTSPSPWCSHTQSKPEGRLLLAKSHQLDLDKLRIAEKEFRALEK
jgi:hypothetical protein